MARGNFDDDDELFEVMSFLGEVVVVVSGGGGSCSYPVDCARVCACLLFLCICVCACTRELDGLRPRRLIFVLKEITGHNTIVRIRMIMMNIAVIRIFSHYSGLT